MPINSDKEISSTRWVPVVALANVDIDDAVGTSSIVLAPLVDHRIVQLCEQYPQFRRWINRFTDAFGASLSPSIILVRDGSPKSVFSADAIGSFRDIISVSISLFERSREIVQPRGRRVLYSDTFEFYPWVIDKDYEDIVAITPGFIGLHMVDKFHGQSSPGLPQQVIAGHLFDQPLLVELLRRWEEAYSHRKMRWEDRALFRSISLATAAMMMPAGPAARMLDYGRSLSLWVSAFEVLVHGGRGDRSGLPSVYRLLEQIDWRKKKLRAKRYLAYPHPYRTETRRTLASWLYGELFRSRNKFTHGAPVSFSDLRIKGSRRALFHLAAPVYRMALARFLRLTPPSLEGLADEELGRAIAERIAFFSPQNMAEEAILNSRIPDEELHDALRERRTRKRRSK